MLDTKKSLEYKKILYSNNGRYSFIFFAELERELKLIFLKYKKYLTESNTKSEFSQKIKLNK